jgi:hypothetical protein
MLRKILRVYEFQWCALVCNIVMSLICVVICLGSDHRSLFELLLVLSSKLLSRSCTSVETVLFLADTCASMLC